MSDRVLFSVGGASMFLVLAALAMLRPSVMTGKRA